MSFFIHSRRHFLKGISVASLAGLISPSWATSTSFSASSKPMKKPKRLAQGMTIGLIAPASNAGENEDIRYAIDVVKSLGFKVKTGKHLFDRTLYLAGEDKNRADDVNAMFADDEVDGIFALRGGYGSPRILPYLDYEMIGRHPKVIMGYSDITALLNAITTQCGFVTFHGPVARQSFSDYTLAEFRKVLMDSGKNIVIGSPPPFETGPGKVERTNRLTRIYPGKARGHLIGGNLSLLVKLLGTPYEPDFRGAILVLEDVNEEPYRVDGMLTHLWLAGRLQEVAGIVFGKCTDCESEGGNSFSLEEVLENRCLPLKVPCIRGMMIGHVEDQTVVPIGGEAELDVEAGTLTLLKGAVS